MARSAPKGGAYSPSGGRFAGQTFTSYRQYRNATAQARGFATLGAQQRAAHPVTTVLEFTKLRPAQRERYAKAREAVSLMRNGEASSLTAAAKQAGIAPAQVKHYAGPALDTSGRRAKVKAHDTLYRPLHVVTTQGVLVLPVASSQDARLVAQHSHAVGWYLNARTQAQLNRANERLDSFTGKTITVDGQIYTLETDRRKLRALAEAGELDYDYIYEDAA